MASVMCVLNEKKVCDNCGECDYCDLNPFKICDNCGKCIGMDQEYREIKIDDVMIGAKSRSAAIFEDSRKHSECTCGECDCHNNHDHNHDNNHKHNHKHNHGNCN